MVEQSLRVQVTSSREITKRALEGEPGIKALCPCSPSNLRAQLPVWVLPFLERRGKRDLRQQLPGGWAGLVPRKAGELLAARAQGAA